MGESRYRASPTPNPSQPRNYPARPASDTDDDASNPTDPMSAHDQGRSESLGAAALSAGRAAFAPNQPLAPGSRPQPTSPMRNSVRAPSAQVSTISHVLAARTPTHSHIQTTLPCWIPPPSSDPPLHPDCRSRTSRAAETAESERRAKSPRAMRSRARRRAPGAMRRRAMTASLYTKHKRALLPTPTIAPATSAIILASVATSATATQEWSHTLIARRYSIYDCLGKLVLYLAKYLLPK